MRRSQAVPVCKWALAPSGHTTSYYRSKEALCRAVGPRYFSPRAVVRPTVVAPTENVRLHAGRVFTDRHRSRTEREQQARSRCAKPMSWIDRLK